MVEQTRPDEQYLMAFIEQVEQATGEWDMEDVLAQDGDVISGATLTEFSVSFNVEDDLPARDVIDMFVDAADQMIGLVRDCDVCRPIGIRDPSMQAKDGTIQLCKRGYKTSVYMAHRFNDGTTTVTLKMLVGKL